MENKFKIEIISPEKIIFSNEAEMVTLPCYEGDMSILKNHISLITFLRPGIIKVAKTDGSLEEFFAQDGTVEFFNENLVLLSVSAINIKNLPKDFIKNLTKETRDQLDEINIDDHNRYILNQKLDALKEIRV